MTDHTVTITDKLKLAALTAAKDAYNDRLVANRRRPGSPNVNTPVEDLPGYLASNEAYIQLLIDREVQKYLVQFGYDQRTIDKKQAELDSLKARMSKANED
jgi:hypothetical protein